MTTLSVSTCFLFHELPVNKQAQLYKPLSGIGGGTAIAASRKLAMALVHM